MAEDKPLRPAYSLFTRSIASVLAFVFIFGPGEFQQLAQGAVSYTNLSTVQWAKGGNTVITYGYDANGGMTSKTTATGGQTTETIAYVYNVQQRLAKVTVDSNPAASDNWLEVTEYTYNHQGIRVEAYHYRLKQDTQAVSNETVTTYLADPFNPTGYAQTLEEWTETGNNASLMTYTLGDDVIAQAKSAWTWNGTTWTLGTAESAKSLLYDGHGSTRQLTSGTPATVANSYSYDAYGHMLGGNPTPANPPATNLLYSGEHFDVNMGMQYLRARWYNQSNGRFTQMDPFAGNRNDPQSLHKYLYCHANPVNGIDPLGLWFFTELGKRAHQEICKMYKAEHLGKVRLGESVPGFAGALLPDIMDLTLKEIGEIKPLSAYGLSVGPPQLMAYLLAANRLNIPGLANKPWTPSEWQVGVRPVPLPDYPNWLVMTIGNACGLIFYKAFRLPKEELKLVTIAAMVALLAQALKSMAQQLQDAARQGQASLVMAVNYLDYQSDVIFNSIYGRQMIFAGMTLGVAYLGYAISARIAMIPVLRFI